MVAFRQPLLLVYFLFLFSSFSSSLSALQATGQVTYAPTSQHSQLPLAGVEIVLCKEGTQEPIATTFTDFEGIYKVEPLSINTRYLITLKMPPGFTNLSGKPNHEIRGPFASDDFDGFFGADFQIVGQPLTIKGLVVNEMTGDLVNGATVTLSLNNTKLSIATTPTHHESFEFNHLAPRADDNSSLDYTLAVSNEGFVPHHTTSFTVNAGQVVNHDVSLTPYGSLIGKVIGKGAGPLANALVEVVQGHAVLASATTDSSGQFVLKDVVPDSYALRASAPNFSNGLETVIVPSSQVAMDFNLEPHPGKVKGQVTGIKTGQFIGNALIQVMQGDHALASTTTDSSGSYILEGLLPDTYTIRATAANCWAERADASIRSNQTEEIHFALKSSVGSLSGSALASDTHAPIADALVEVLEKDKVILSSTPDHHANYHIENLPSGLYSIRVSAPHFDAMEETISIVPDQITTLNVSLRPHSKLYVAGPVKINESHDSSLSPLLAYQEIKTHVDHNPKIAVAEKVLHDLASDHGPQAPHPIEVLSHLTHHGESALHLTAAEIKRTEEHGHTKGAENHHHKGVDIPDFQISLPTIQNSDSSLPSNHNIATDSSSFPLPPKKISIKVRSNKFATQKSQFYSIKWKASPDPSVVSYRLYSNKKLIATIPAGKKLNFNDRGKRKGKRTVYQVTAVNASGQESNLVSAKVR